MRRSTRAALSERGYNFTSARTLAPLARTNRHSRLHNSDLASQVERAARTRPGFGGPAKTTLARIFLLRKRNRPRPSLGKRSLRAGPAKLSGCFWRPLVPPFDPGPVVSSMWNSAGSGLERQQDPGLQVCARSRSRWHDAVSGQPTTPRVRRHAPCWASPSKPASKPKGSSSSPFLLGASEPVRSPYAPTGHRVATSIRAPRARRLAPEFLCP